MQGSVRSEQVGLDARLGPLERLDLGEHVLTRPRQGVETLGRAQPLGSSCRVGVGVVARPRVRSGGPRGASVSARTCWRYRVRRRGRPRRRPRAGSRVSSGE
ncbi:hypothetical protein [Terrabacter sp. NPDC000476]|uniref:hypothetical protein n=1 Tax=Terrabacter sp. NPDC000476 TaxID=3154258 RepID=UPI00331719FE